MRRAVMTRPKPTFQARRHSLPGSIPIDGVTDRFALSPTTPVGPPAKWKMAIVGFTAIYPLVLLVPPLIGPLLPPGPRWLHILIQMMVITPLMTWAALPLATMVFKRFFRFSTKVDASLQPDNGASS